MRVLINPLATRAPYAAREALVVSKALAETARREIMQWEGYEPTPLRSLAPLARRLRLGTLLYKDESGRLGQGSFKSLGGAYAAGMRLRELENPARTVLCCATDGNHGRSVAFAAERFGCSCVVFMHAGAPPAKAAAITALGARVVRVTGTYDDSVREAHAAAKREGWLLVADTSDDESDPTTRLVMQGYGVMVLEILEQLPGAQPPTHVVVQGGVGGLAAAVAGVFAEVYGERRPRVIVVEPEASACLLESALHRALRKVEGDLATAMEMLSAGEASPVAWPILQRRADVFIAIEDAAAIDAARMLSESSGASAGLNVGVTGAAGVAGLMELLREEDLAATLELGPDARVLVFGTEEALPGPD
ncbi:MAG: diaminopropionate ammonia-lyase [Woeseia sp.]